MFNLISEKSISRKSLILRNFSLFYYPGMRQCYTLSNFHSIIGQVIAYGRRQSEFQTFSSESAHGWLQEVATYNRWKLLVHWKTGH